MNLKSLSQLFGSRDLRNAALGIVVVFGGLGLSALTIYAHQVSNERLAVISAGASLLFALLILIFVVPPLARNAGREASQMNLPFEFTTGGAIMLVLVMIVGFSAWTTGNNLLFIVLSFLLGAVVVGFFAGSICLKRLDVKMRFPDTIFAGEPTPILVSLTNRKRIFPAFSVVVEVRGRERERSIAAAEMDAILPRWIASRLTQAPIVRRTLSHFAYIGRGQTAESKSEHVFPNRGRLLIKDFELSTKFPFGFFRHRRRLPARSAELIVFPKIQEVDVGIENSQLNTGNHPGGKRGTGIDLLALRGYQPHDELRRIDWKATARTQALTVREYAGDDEKRVTVIFDTSLPPSDENILPLRKKIESEQGGKPVVASERFETGASLAASIMAHFAAENAEIQLIINDEPGEFAHGRPHLHEHLRRLALAEPAPTASISTEPEPHLPRILNESDGSYRFLVTANPDRLLPAEISQQLTIVPF